MILADTSVWIDHIKSSNPGLSAKLEQDQVLMHSFVLGELGLGSLRNRAQTLLDLQAFDFLAIARPSDMLALIENARLYSRGLGYVDVQLLASCLIHGDCKLLTRDRRLREAAEMLGVAA